MRISCAAARPAVRGFPARFAVLVPFRPFSVRSERSAVAFLACFAFGLRALVRGLRFKALKRRFLGRSLSSWVNIQLFFFRAFTGLFWACLLLASVRACRPAIVAGVRPSLFFEIDHTPYITLPISKQNFFHF